MTATHKGIMESVKDKLIGSIKGTGEILNTVVDTVSAGPCPSRFTR